MARTGFFVTSAMTRRREQTQTGNEGGHVQPAVCRWKTSLDDPVLERVVREDGEARAEREARDRVVEETLELDELAVRGDAQRLEDARRGILVLLPPRAERPQHETPHLAGGPDGSRLPGFHDPSGDRSGHALFPPFAENPRQFLA